MTDEQILAAAKAIDTPYGKVALIHVREDGQEVPTLMAKQFAAALAAAPSVPAGFKLVPVEPTWDQCVAGIDVDLTDWFERDGIRQVRECSARDIYCAMVAAAPEAPQQDAPRAALPESVPYGVALTAIERLRGCAATMIEDHSKERYTLNDQTMPQDVAYPWAREIHNISAKDYLDEAIQDAKDKC